MPLTTTFDDLLGAKDAMRALSETAGLPGKFRMNVVRLIKVANEQLTLLQEERNRLIKEYAGDNTNDDGDAQVPDERIGEYQTKFIELLRAELEIPIERVEIPFKFIETPAAYLALESIVNIIDIPEDPADDNSGEVTDGKSEEDQA